MRDETTGQTRFLTAIACHLWDWALGGRCWIFRKERGEIEIQIEIGIEIDRGQHLTGMQTPREH